MAAGGQLDKLLMRTASTPRSTFSIRILPPSLVSCPLWVRVVLGTITAQHLPPTW